MTFEMKCKWLPIFKSILKPYDGISHWFLIEIYGKWLILSDILFIVKNVLCSSVFCFIYMLGMFTKLWKATINLIMYVCLSVRWPCGTTLLSLGRFSWNYIQWTLELRPAWHTNNLGYDQSFSFDLRPKSWVKTRMPVKDKTCIRLCGCKQRPEMRS
jgi:hypothetical protein